MWKDFLFERCTLGLVYSRRNLCWYFSESIVSKPNLSLFAIRTQTFQKSRRKLCLAPFWFLYSSKHFALIRLLVLVLMDPVLKGCDQTSQQCDTWSSTWIWISVNWLSADQPAKDPSSLVMNMRSFLFFNLFTLPDDMMWHMMCVILCQLVPSQFSLSV